MIPKRLSMLLYEDGLRVGAAHVCSDSWYQKLLEQGYTPVPEEVASDAFEALVADRMNRTPIIDFKPVVIA
ncbi:MAG: hypothetical protein KKG75_01915 [Nanoarchaeota archaeon]|nr:hypothetical protein [Nanoarchaeota archaeon]